MSTNKLSPSIIEFLERNTTINFLNAAKEFVELLETSDIDKNIFYPKAHLKLLELYLAGHKLEAIELIFFDDKNEFEDDFEYKNADLISELGGEQFYWEVFDPTYNDDNESSQGMLWDDFADIYKDLKRSLSQMDKIGTDEAIEDALWQFKWGFSNHWGHHCINALRYLHYLAYDGKQTI